MTAATTERYPSTQDESQRQWPLKAGVKILRGSVVGLVKGTGTIDNITADNTM